MTSILEKRFGQVRAHVSNWWAVARGPNVVRHVFSCASRSFNFKPQPAHFFGTVVVYTCLQRRTMFFAML